MGTQPTSVKVVRSVYSYQNILGKEQWSQLPDNPGLIGLVWQLLMVYSLVWVGGATTVPLTLSSVSQEKVRGNNGLRSSLPCLHHVRDPACVTTEQALVVAGGI